MREVREKVVGVQRGLPHWVQQGVVLGLQGGQRRVLGLV
jgi:hypothetical protein